MSTALRPYLLFALVSLCLLVTALQFSMVSVALPDLIEDLAGRFAGATIMAYKPSG